MQASIRNRFITKPFDLFLEMQHAALEIADHRIVGIRLEQSPLRALAAAVQDQKYNLVLARSESAHEIIQRKSGRYGNGGLSPHRSENVRSSCTSKKPKLLKQPASPMRK
jgi:hypothetical protein